jgi:hypothetical protein
VGITKRRITPVSIVVSHSGSRMLSGKSIAASNVREQPDKLRRLNVMRICRLHPSLKFISVSACGVASRSKRRIRINSTVLLLAAMKETNVCSAINGEQNISPGCFTVKSVVVSLKLSAGKKTDISAQSNAPISIITEHIKREGTNR